VFGYPIDIKVDKFGRFWTTPVIEIISKEGLQYLTKLNKPRMVEGQQKYTSIFGQDFTHWFPLYINKKHFKMSKAEISSTLSLLCSMGK